MKKKALLGFILVLLSMAVVVSVISAVVSYRAESELLMAVDLAVHNIDSGEDFSTIQGAINDNETLDGHTLLVDAGTYYEQVVVNKSVSLVGENKSRTIIDGIGTGTVIKVMANNVNISGFTMRQGHFGIAVYRSSNKISDNIIANNSMGIILYNSSNNVLSGNTASNNLRNFGVEGSDLSDFNNYVDVTNTVNGKPIYYLVNETNTVITGRIHAGTFYLINCKEMAIKDLNLTNNLNGIFLWNTTNSKIENVNVSKNFYGISLCGYSSNNTISGSTASSNNYGIYFADSNYNVLTGNNVSNNIEGIHLDHSTNNTIKGNTVANNSHIGIYLKGSDNVILHNNLNNTNQVYVTAGLVNTWDDSYLYSGNYWSNYNGADLDGDGVGDTPYIINNLNKDNYPLMSSWVPSPSAFWMQWWLGPIVIIVIIALAGAFCFLRNRKNSNHQKEALTISEPEEIPPTRLLLLRRCTSREFEARFPKMLTNDDRYT